jgi:hypothetical protein
LLELVAGEHLVRQWVYVIVYAASDVSRLEAREMGNVRVFPQRGVRVGEAASHGSENLVRLACCRTRSFIGTTTTGSSLARFSFLSLLHAL